MIPRKTRCGRTLTDEEFNTREKLYKQAVVADSRLVYAERVIDALVELVRDTDRMCYGCVWERIVKPLMTPAVGWARGDLPRQAKAESEFRLMHASELKMPEKVPAESELEEWMRTSEAWDVVSDVWLDRLWHADPNNDHGIARGAA